MPPRSCCSCREKKDTSHLIRLSLESHDKNSALRVQTYRPPVGRSAWVCYESKCIRQIVKKPKMLRRSLKQTPETSDLIVTFRKYLRVEIRNLLEKIHRSGRAFDPKEKPEKSAQYWIYYETTLANTNKMEYLRNEKDLYFQVILGETPPSHLFSTIGIQSGKFSQQLLKNLRLLQLIQRDEEMP